MWPVVTSLLTSAAQRQAPPPAALPSSRSGRGARPRCWGYADPLQGVEGRRVAARRSHMVAGVWPAATKCGGGQRGCRRRFRRARDFPAGKSRRGGREGHGGARRGRRFERGGAERRRWASAATATSGRAGERGEGEGVVDVIAEKSLHFARITFWYFAGGFLQIARHF